MGLPLIGLSASKRASVQIGLGRSSLRPKQCTVVTDSTELLSGRGPFIFLARPEGLLETAFGLFQPCGLRGAAARIKTLARFVEQESSSSAETRQK